MITWFPASNGRFAPSLRICQDELTLRTAFLSVEDSIATKLACLLQNKFQNVHLTVTFLLLSGFERESKQLTATFNFGGLS